MKELKVRLTTIEGMLGTKPADPDIYRRFIGDKAPDAQTVEEEIKDLGTDKVVELGMTVFPRLEDGTPYIFNYQVEGFFKDSCGALQRLTTKTADGKKAKAANESSKLTAYKKIIDGLIFVKERKIPIIFDGEITTCQRPLRAQTAMGERVALAISEEIPAGATMEFTVVCFSDDHVAAVKEWLDYGMWRGLGQWRNSGKGRFTWEETTDEKQKESA